MSERPRSGGEVGGRTDPREMEVTIPIDRTTLAGTLVVPEGAPGIILFAHGAGSSRLSPRNRYVAGVLRERGLGTLLFDLLTEAEEADRENVFDIERLAERLVGATRWLDERMEMRSVRVGYFGASTGAAAALVAAARLPERVSAVVSRGGRPDLAGDALASVRAPTLLIVGGEDTPVIAMNEDALAGLSVEKRLEIVPGATHLFEEPGTLEAAAGLAADWFECYLGAREETRRAA